MPLPPAIPFGGIAGLRFLDQTVDRQFALFDSSPDIKREVDYFLENAGDITTVDGLFNDRRILSVVLGAFGLDEDINRGAFVRKVIEEGTLDDDAFANRLVDPAYRELASFLGFGDVGGTLVFENTRLNIVDRFRQRQFENNIGEVDVNLRLALNFRREAAEIATNDLGDDTKIFQLLGSPPLREVLESALNMPAEFGLIDLDQQVAEIKSRARSLFGSSDPAEFLAPGENLERFVDRFMLNQQVRQGGISNSTPGSVALGLLQTAGLGSFGQANLFASNF